MVAKLADLRHELIADLRGKRTFLVVGTGTSIQATRNTPTASWEGLIKHGLKYAQAVRNHDKGWLTSQLTLLKKAFGRQGSLQDILDLASAVETNLDRPKGEWVKWLGRSVGSLRAQDRSVLEVLVKLSAGRMATTNYDHLLSQVPRSNLPPVPWTKAEEAHQIIIGKARGVLHLHGEWKTPESVVLGRKSYDVVVDNEFAQAVQRSLAVTKSLVFVGFGAGLEDPNFGPLLEWLAPTLGTTTHQHYRLCLTKEVAALQKLHQGQRVQLIIYGQKHQDLGPYLQGLLDEIKPPKRGPTGPSVSRGKAPSAAPASPSPPGRAPSPVRRKAIRAALDRHPSLVGLLPQALASDPRKPQSSTDVDALVAHIEGMDWAELGNQFVGAYRRKGIVDDARLPGWRELFLELVLTSTDLGGLAEAIKGARASGAEQVKLEVDTSCHALVEAFMAGLEERVPDYVCPEDPRGEAEILMPFGTGPDADGRNAAAAIEGWIALRMKDFESNAATLVCPPKVDAKAARAALQAALEWETTQRVQDGKGRWYVVLDLSERSSAELDALQEAFRKGHLPVEVVGRKGTDDALTRRHTTFAMILRTLLGYKN